VFLLCFCCVFIDSPVKITMVTQISKVVGEETSIPTPQGGFSGSFLSMNVWDLLLYIILLIILGIFIIKGLQWFFARREDVQRPDFYEENREAVVRMCKKHVDTRYYTYRRWDILKLFPRGIPVCLKDPRNNSDVVVGNYVGHTYTEHDGCLNVLYGSSREHHLGRFFPCLSVLKIRTSEKQLTVDYVSKRGDETNGKKNNNKLMPKLTTVDFPTAPFFWSEYSLDVFCGGLDEFAGFEYPILIDDEKHIIDQRMFVANDWAKLAETFQRRDLQSGYVTSMYKAVRLNPEGMLKKTYGARGMGVETSEIPSG